MRLLLAAALAVLLAPALAGCSSGGGKGSTGAGACDGITRSSIANVQANHTLVAIATDEGCIVAEMYDDKAPVTVRNFLNYTSEGFYDDTLVHRISKDFVLQGGGWAKDGTRKQGHPPIVNEARSSGLHNLQYTFSMARTNSPNSATSEFFINVKDNSSCLDAVTGRCDPSGNGYAVFAKVVQGDDVVEAIHGLPRTTSSAHPYCINLEDSQGGSCPVDPVIVHSAKILA